MFKNIIFSAIMTLIPALTNAGAAELDYTLTDLDGNTVELKSLIGEKLTVLDFWATWCGPCVRSIPQLVKISEDYKDKGVSLIGINEDGPRNLSKVKPFVRTRRVNYTVVADTEGSMLQDLNVSALPTLLIFNAEGKELFRHEGFFPGDESLIREELERLLDQ